MGQQLTINGTISNAEQQRLNQLRNIANSSNWIQLIAHARIDGVQRGFTLQSGSSFDSDISGNTTSQSELVSVAANGDPVTFTLVAQGMATRLALDFDLDGTLNGDERDSDADGMTNITENSFGTTNDSDGDGLANSVDRDSDGDSIADVVEAGLQDINGDYTVDDTSQLGSVNNPPGLRC